MNTAPPARQLPAILQEISDLAGMRAALALASDFGGTRIYIPMVQNLKDQDPLVVCVGIVAARKISKHFCREQISIPLANEPLAQKIVRELDAGISAAKIARKLGTTERHVWRVKSRVQLKSDPDRRGLFDKES